MIPADLIKAAAAQPVLFQRACAIASKKGRRLRPVVERLSAKLDRFVPVPAPAASRPPPPDAIDELYAELASLSSATEPEAVRRRAEAFDELRHLQEAEAAELEAAFEVRRYRPSTAHGVPDSSR